LFQSPRAETETAKSQNAVGNSKIQGEEMKRITSLMRDFQNDESGQGLVEYLLIIALIALAATAGMSSAASYINSAFIRIGGRLGSYIS
jgi:Flp pilus assembly pilin Flp